VHRDYPVWDRARCEALCNGRYGASEGMPVLPGDIIAWLQHPRPDLWMQVADVQHAFAAVSSRLSMCDKGPFQTPWPGNGARCESCARKTRKGHVAVIVAVDDESITTVGWGEGSKPGRVMMRQLWRDQERSCVVCVGFGLKGADRKMCRSCNGLPVPRSSTVLWRFDGGLHGIARPVAR
jgi:hypothetical protein